MLAQLQGEDSEGSSDKDGGAERPEINIVVQESLQSSAEQDKQKSATVSQTNTYDEQLAGLEKLVADEEQKGKELMAMIRAGSQEQSRDPSQNRNEQRYHATQDLEGISLS